MQCISAAFNQWSLTCWFRCLNIIVIFLFIMLQSACTNPPQEKPKPPIVKVANVIQRDVPINYEWIGTTDGLVNATIRAQVQGYLISQDYKEGTPVKKGQILFEIDPRPFQAALEQAKGQLAQQQARWTTAKANLSRIKPLAEQNAVSKKDRDDAIGMELAAHASVIAAKAVVDKAKLDLGFTKIRSPINGVAGIAKAQIGNLVGPGVTEELTTVSTVNPIKVYVSISEQEYLQAVERQKRNVSQPTKNIVMFLADGSEYSYRGSFYLADRQVDPKTGTIRVAAIFDNPSNILRPGQFARVRATVATKKGALLVPQQSLAELQGSYFVAVVGPDNKVQNRPVKVSETIDGLQVVDKGLKPGERVVVEGIQKAKPGTPVTPTPYYAEKTGNIPGEQLASAKPEDNEGQRK